MYEIMPAHPITMLIVIGTMMVTPLYVYATYISSGASARKGMIIGTAFLLFGAFMFWVGISDTPRQLGLPGNLIVPAAWIIPSLILFIWRDWFLSAPLSQKWLIGLQLFRAIGGVFLIEMLMGNIPGIFAHPAGWGDLFAAFVALVILVIFWNKDRISSNAIWLLIVVGVTDFMSAFFFGFTSSASPIQLFHPEIPNNVIMFPTGMIPLFLVPYAIFFHTLSGLNELKFGQK